MSVCVNDRDGDGDCAACARNPEAPCRMTARQAVHHLFENGLTSYRLDGFLDAYAHELAERIRADANRLAVFRSEDMRMRAAHGRRMADLIDPEVSNGSVERTVQHP